MMQRKDSKPGAGLGRTTGWIHRTEVSRRGVRTIPGVTYGHLDDEGLHITVNDRPMVLAVDTVVVCTGQESRRDLAEELGALAVPVHVIGGADVAAELDAKRAIRAGTVVGAQL